MSQFTRILINFVMLIAVISLSCEQMAAEDKEHRSGFLALVGNSADQFDDPSFTVLGAGAYKESYLFVNDNPCCALHTALRIQPLNTFLQAGKNKFAIQNNTDGLLYLKAGKKESDGQGSVLGSLKALPGDRTSSMQMNVSDNLQKNYLFDCTTLSDGEKDRTKYKADIREYLESLKKLIKEHRGKEAVEQLTWKLDEKIKISSGKIGKDETRMMEEIISNPASVMEDSTTDYNFVFGKQIVLVEGRDSAGKVDPELLFAVVVKGKWRLEITPVQMCVMQNKWHIWGRV